MLNNENYLLIDMLDIGASPIYSTTNNNKKSEVKMYIVWIEEKSMFLADYFFVADKPIFAYSLEDALKLKSYTQAVSLAEKVNGIILEEVATQ